MSFEIVDMYKDQVWEDDAIDKKLEDYIEVRFDIRKQLFIFRIIAGEMKNQYVPSAAEVELQQNYMLTCMQARQAGILARKNNAILKRVIDHEQGVAPLQEDDEEAQIWLMLRQDRRNELNPPMAEEPVIEEPSIVPQEPESEPGG